MLKIINRFLRAKCILTIAFLMVLVLVLPQNISKAADEVIAVGRPRISVSVNGESVKLDNQVLIDYLVETLNGKVSEQYSDPYGDGRIVAVEGFEDFR
jgi:hypothetical protein